MNKNKFKIFSGLFFLLTMSASHAKCYPGLDCDADLPGNKTSPTATPAANNGTTAATTDQWQMLDRYQVKGGLTKDPATGLMWMRCSIGQNWDGLTCQGKAVEINWDQAMNLPKNFEYLGYDDWRVATVEELKTLIYCSSGKTEMLDSEMIGCSNNYVPPTIAQTAFPETPSTGAWSSSLNANNSGYVWVVNFSNGDDDYDSKSSSNAVRLVRGKQ